jgi:hypothetical protein
LHRLVLPSDVRDYRLANQNRLPAIYPYRVGPAGGLLTYGFNIIEPHRSPAEYIDRILKERILVIFRCRSRRNSSWGSQDREDAWFNRPQMLQAIANEVIE